MKNAPLCKCGVSQQSTRSMMRMLSLKVMASCSEAWSLSFRMTEGNRSMADDDKAPRGSEVCVSRTCQRYQVD